MLHSVRTLRLRVTYGYTPPFGWVYEATDVEFAPQVLESQVCLAPAQLLHRLLPFGDLVPNEHRALIALDTPF